MNKVLSVTVVEENSTNYSFPKYIYLSALKFRESLRNTLGGSFQPRHFFRIIVFLFIVGLVLILCYGEYRSIRLKNVRLCNMERCYQIPHDRMIAALPMMQEEHPKLYHWYRHLIPSYETAMQHIRKYVNADQIPAFPVSAEMKSRIGDSVSQSPDCFFLEIEYIEDGGQVCGYRLECEDPKFSYDVSDFQGSQIHRMEGYMGWITRQSVSPFDPHDSKTSFIGGYFADPIHRASYWPLGLRAISVLYLHEVPDQVPFGICRDITNRWGYIECHGKIPTTMEGLSKLKLRLRLRLTNGTLTEAIPVWINPMEYSSLAIISPVENIP